MLREGLERILRGRTGALIVLGTDKVVDSIASGGFPLEVEFSPTRLRELAKMDGAIVCDREASRILRAGTQLLPDPSIETTESGTRHRTAERVAKQTGYPVIAVSQSMRIIALYVGQPAARARGLQRDHVPGEPGAGHPRAVQAAARRGHRHAVRAGDRGPGHGARRRRRDPAARDGPPDQRRDLRLRHRARQRRPAAHPAARGAHRRRRPGPRARDPRLPEPGGHDGRLQRDARPASARCRRPSCSTSARSPG